MVLGSREIRISHRVHLHHRNLNFYFLKHFCFILISGRCKTWKKTLTIILKMMPQFDTFSFFSQLFWVFLAFSYLYLVLCFYLLPAFSAALKVRSKKLAQVDSITNTTSVVSSSTSNLLFFENITSKLGGIFFYRKSLTGDINSAYSHLLFKNEAFYQFNFLMLNQFKVVTFFI